MNPDKESTSVPSGKPPVFYKPGEDPPDTQEPRKVIVIPPDTPFKRVPMIRHTTPPTPSIHRASTMILCSNCHTHDFSKGVFNLKGRLYCFKCAP